MAELFRVALTADQELAPAPTQAHGEGAVRWDAEAGILTFDLHLTGVDFAPIGGEGRGTVATADDVTNFHLHNAARGEAGAVVFNPTTPISDADGIQVAQNPDGSWDVHGVWVITDPALASVATFADLLTGAKPGDDVPLYFNVHTTGVPTGEVRGQWVAVAEEGRPLHAHAYHSSWADAVLT
jgi:serralysin